MSMNMFGDETLNQLNVQNDADFDSDVNIDGNLVVIGTITGIFNGSANSIQDIDNTTSIDTDAIAETLTFSTNSIVRATIDTSLTVNVDYNSTSGGISLTNGDVNLTNGDITITNGDLNATLATAAQPNITSIGTLTSLTTSGDINTSTDYNIGGIQVLSSTTLGSGVVNSSLTNFGTLTSLDVGGDINTSTDYNISSTQVLGATTLGSGVINSSLTSNTGNLTNTGTLIVSTNTQPQIAARSTTGGGCNIYCQNITTGTSNTNGLKIGLNNSEAGQVWNYQNTALIFATNNDEKMRISAGGNVGIGIDPSYPLDVVGDINTTTALNIASTEVLSSTTLGSGVINSSLTSIGTLTSLTTTGDIISTAGEVQTFSCQTIGALGYILVDSVSTTALSNANFTSLKANFNDTAGIGSQSLDPFAIYTMMIRGDHDGNGNNPHIEYRFFDNTGEISDTNAYQNEITAFGGAAVVSNRATNGELVFANGNSSLVNFYFGEFRIALGDPTNPQNTYISGQYTCKIGNGTGLRAANVGNSLTDLAVIDTKIREIGFRAQNVNTGANRNLQVRIYRLM